MVLCATIYLLAPWRYWAAILYRPFTREFPRYAFKFALALTAYSLFAVTVTLHAPALWPALALAASVAIARDAWRARASYGRSRGLPPGSLAPMNLSALFDQDYHAVQARRHGPIFKSRFFLAPVACVVGMERGLDLLKGAGTKIRPPKYPLNKFIPGGFLRALPPAQHACYREVFRDVFAAEVVAACAPAIGETIRSALSSAAARSAQDPEAGVQMRADIYRMVFNAWLLLFFGIRSDTPVAGRLEKLYRHMDIRYRNFSSTRSIARAVDEITGIVRDQSRSFREQKGRGAEVTRCFLSRLIEARPDVAEDPVVIGNLLFLLHTSWGDISGFSQWVLKLLCDNPGWTDRLRAELDSGELEKDANGKDLLDRIILETFRFEQSELLMRIVDEDVSVGGFTIPRGWLVRLCVRESHRLPEVFDDPDTFNPDRFKNHTFSRNEFSPFGAFQYACLGPAVTMTIGRVFISKLVRGFEWKVTSSGPPEFNAWCHWRPSSRFRIAFASRH